MVNSELVVKVSFQDAYTRIRLDGPIRGQPGTPFIDVLEKNLPSSSESGAYFLVLTGAESERELLLVDSNATLGTVAELFGEETIQVDNGGRGGGGWWVTVTQLAEYLPGVGKVVRGARDLRSAAIGLRYSDERGAVKDWDDTGDVSPSLQRMVLSENPWPRRLFDRTFGLSRDRGSELLRTQGYFRWGYGSEGEELWRRRESE